jgi:uncharacterized phage protein (TIGR01671 family)
MKREIKFRVWDKEDKKFFKPIYEAYKGGLLDLSISLSGELLRRTLEIPCEHESRFPDRYVVQQFTGLKDKNGVEIYEGDTDGIGNVVEYLNGCFCLNGDRPLNWMLNIFEVKGNIHETPELI